LLGKKKVLISEVAQVVRKTKVLISMYKTICMASNLVCKFVALFLFSTKRGRKV